MVEWHNTDRILRWESYGEQSVKGHKIFEALNFFLFLFFYMIKNSLNQWNLNSKLDHVRLFRQKLQKYANNKRFRNFF